MRFSSSEKERDTTILFISQPNRTKGFVRNVAGAVAGAFYGVPEKIKQQAFSRLQKEFLDVIQNFETLLLGKEE